MALALVALGVAPPHLLHAHRPIPVVGGGDGAAVGAEADEIALVAIRLAHELADIQLAARAHLGVARIADVRVVLPHDRLGAAAAGLQQRLERVVHVPVAQVP